MAKYYRSWYQCQTISGDLITDYRSPEVGGDANHTYSSDAGTAKMNWPCYQNAWRAGRTKSELQVGKRSKGGQKKRFEDTLKASLKNFNKPPESCEQTAQDRAK